MKSYLVLTLPTNKALVHLASSFNCCALMLIAHSLYQAPIKLASLDFIT